MRFRTWAKAMLLGAALYGGLTASAQNSAPATPAPYNPIALAEVTGAPRTAVQAGQSNYQTLSQNPYLGGVPLENSAPRQWRFPSKTPSPSDSSKISAGIWPRMRLPTREDSAGKR